MAITGTVEDREEIRVLHSRYCWTIDGGRYDDWVDCFTEDGVFDSPRFGKYGGRDALKRFAALYKESLGGAQVLHVVANPAFDLNGDSGSGTAHLL
ncbi:MAG: nuclear transport factor 2 family protein, partial [Candidatus Binatus sp.]